MRRHPRGSESVTGREREKQLRACEFREASLSSVDCTRKRSKAVEKSSWHIGCPGWALRRTHRAPRAPSTSSPSSSITVTPAASSTAAAAALAT